MEDAAWHEQAVGGHWDSVGRLQMRFLLDHGVQPHHRVLDVACGSFRLGRHLLPYLAPGRYTGVDGDFELLAAGVDHVIADLMDREPMLVYARLPRPLPTADIVWMHALLDHMEPEAGRATLRHAMDAAPTVFATVFLVDEPDHSRLWLRNGSHDGSVVTYPDREYWHHDRNFLDSIGFPYTRHEYAHPLGLTVIEFSRELTTQTPAAGA